MFINKKLEHLSFRRLVETNSVAWGSMRFSVSKSADPFSGVASAISSANASA